MKKTLLATAIAGALGVTAAAQAATVYDQDGTKVDIYGRIAMGIEGGGSDAGGVDNGAEFRDAFSRLGVRLQHMVSSDLTAFGHLEWRFSGDGGDNRFDAFSETRQSYFGLRSDSWGTIQAGNFDSFYKDAVSSPFDVWINEGLEFAGHPKQSRGDSIGYITPNLNGFQAFLQAKHYSERGESDGSARDEEVVTQGGVVYETGGLRLAAGFVDDKFVGTDVDPVYEYNPDTTSMELVSGPTVTNDSGGNDEVLYGATASYQFTPEFSARVGYEGRDQNDDISASNGFDKWGLGLSYAVNQWTFHANVYDVDADGDGEDRNPWAAGAYYNISSNFDVFLELYDSDEEYYDLYYLTGARYFF